MEPLLSEQWFVKMDEMRDLALKLMNDEGLPHFYPEVPNRKVYTTWLENLRDWTISRQLWWGHQIPAWYDDKGGVYVARTADEAYEQAGTKDLVQDQDVLDTWFSSALWPFSTLGWQGVEPPASAGGNDVGADLATGPPAHAGGSAFSDDLQTFYPTDVLITGRDIIFLWVSRMVMTGMKFIGKKPFDDVVVTGTVLDKNGQRMSKTKGNGVDPLEVFDKYGVDATRMTLAGSATGMDFAWRDEKVESFRNFANKIWNATRFCLMNAEGAAVDHASLMAEPPASAGGNDVNAVAASGPPAHAGGSAFSLADRWIISRLNRTAMDVNRALEKYEFHTAVSLLYHFFWDDFCDWYIELVKDEITRSGDTSVPMSAKHEDLAASADADESVRAPSTRILTILEIALRMLHPFMPYLTEELWLKLPGISSDLLHNAYKDAAPSIMLTSFPPGDMSAIDDAAEKEMGAVIELITKVRNIRAEMNISPSIRFKVHVAAEPVMQEVFRTNEPQILKLARAETLIIGDELDVPKASAKAVTTDASIAVPLEGLIDFEKERERLSGQISKLSEEKARLDAQLSNTNFVERAPAEKVSGLRDRSAELEVQIATLQQNVESLG